MHDGQQVSIVLNTELVRRLEWLELALPLTSLLEVIVQSILFISPHTHALSDRAVHVHRNECLCIGGLYVPITTKHSICLLLCQAVADKLSTERSQIFLRQRLDDVLHCDLCEVGLHTIASLLTLYHENCARSGGVCRTLVVVCPILHVVDTTTEDLTAHHPTNHVGGDVVLQESYFLSLLHTRYVSIEELSKILLTTKLSYHLLHVVSGFT